MQHEKSTEVNGLVETYIIACILGACDATILPVYRYKRLLFVVENIKSIKYLSDEYYIHLHHNGATLMILRISKVGCEHWVLRLEPRTINKDPIEGSTIRGA